MACFRCLLIVLLLSTIANTKIDYYWRNFNGVVPNDAIEAGLDKSGKPIYVGQGFFGCTGLLPGTLYPGSTNVTVTAVQKVFTTDKSVKILCSGHPYNFRWTPVNKYEDIALLTNVHFVDGGTETNSIVNIGRAQHEGSLEVGKVYNLAPYLGLALPNQKQGETRYQSFEILTYSLNVIDVRFDSK